MVIPQAESNSISKWIGGAVCHWYSPQEGVPGKLIRTASFLSHVPSPLDTEPRLRFYGNPHERWYRGGSTANAWTFIGVGQRWWRKWFYGACTSLARGKSRGSPQWVFGNVLIISLSCSEYHIKSLQFANLIIIALWHCLAQPNNKNVNRKNPEDLREKIAGNF